MTGIAAAGGRRGKEPARHCLPRPIAKWAVVSRQLILTVQMLSAWTVTGAVIVPGGVNGLSLVGCGDLVRFPKRRVLGALVVVRSNGQFLVGCEDLVRFPKRRVLGALVVVRSNGLFLVGCGDLVRSPKRRVLGVLVAVRSNGQFLVGCGDLVRSPKRRVLGVLVAVRSRGPNGGLVLEKHRGRLVPAGRGDINGVCVHLRAR